MNLRITAGAASSFAHLLGMGTKGVRAQKPEEEDEDEEKKLEEGDVPEETKPNDEEEDQEKPDAEAPDDDESAEAADDEEEDKDDDPKTRKAKAAARMRERARCAAIFRSKAAALRPDLAAELAFNTGLSAKRARDVLTAAAATGAPGNRTLSSTLSNAQLADRMARVSIPNPGTGSAPAAGSAAAVAQQIVAINNRRLGLK